MVDPTSRTLLNLVKLQHFRQYSFTLIPDLKGENMLRGPYH